MKFMQSNLFGVLNKFKNKECPVTRSIGKPLALPERGY